MKMTNTTYAIMTLKPLRLSCPSLKETCLYILKGQNRTKHTLALKNQILASTKDDTSCGKKRNFSAKINLEHLLTPGQCRDVIAANERTTLIPYRDVTTPDVGRDVTRVDTNYLASNHPIEDRIALARSPALTLAAVFDGHLGPFCAHLLASRFLDFVGLTLAPGSALDHVANQLSARSRGGHVTGEPPDWSVPAPYKLVDSLDPMEGLGFGANPYTTPKFPDDLYRGYVERLMVERSSSPHPALDEDGGPAFLRHPWMMQNLERAFATFDQMVSTRAHLAIQDAMAPIPDQLSLSALAKVFPDVKIAFSGSTACLAYVDCSQDPPVLFVANVGDSRAVLGSVGPNGEWVTTKLSYKHYSDNTWENRRLKADHPVTESNTILKGGRLLGYLMPTRSFGDMMFKWDLKDVIKIRRLFPSLDVYVPSHYYTPPYLTAKPEIISHVIRPEDKFVVIATDGLWDFLTTRQVVKIVGQHLAARSKTTGLTGGGSFDVARPPVSSFDAVPTNENEAPEEELELDLVSKDFRPDSHDEDIGHPQGSPGVTPTLTPPDPIEPTNQRRSDVFQDPPYHPPSVPEREDIPDVGGNAATLLIEHALGSSGVGGRKGRISGPTLDYVKLSTLLKLPPEISRDFRDDISVLVLYFDP